MSLIQPLGQKLLSNVSVIKLDKKGKHFEIAVLPNKVSSWRRGLETDLDSVVQSHSIFSNVDQGMLAKQSDVFETLGVDTLEKGLLMILQQGKLRLAEKERKLVIGNLTKDIASIVASQCININTQRPLTTSTVERAMKEIGFSVKISKAAKAQALLVIRKLKSMNYPIARARIRLMFYIKPDQAEQMKSMLPHVESVDSSNPMQTTIIAQVDPGSLRGLAQELAHVFGTEVRIDVMELNVAPIGDAIEKETEKDEEEEDEDELCE